MFENKLHLCKKCAYYDHPYCPPEGSPNAEIVFCGDSPWRTEIERHRPLIGPAGDVFNALLDSCNLERRDVYITNVVKCKPDNLGEAYPPGVVELCTELFLKRELERIKPKLVVPMGNSALKGLGISKNITSMRGLVSDHEFKGITYKILPTYHTSFILRKPAYLPYAAQDFEAAQYFLENNMQKPQNNDLHYRSVTTKTQLESFFKEFEQAKFIAWDTETTGLDYRTDEILSMQFSFAPKTGYCLPFYKLPYEKYDGAHETAIFNDAVVTKLLYLLENKDKIFFFHNGKFDLRMMYYFFLRHFNLYFNIDNIHWYDTMAMYGLLNENTFQGLKEVSKMHTDLRYTSEELSTVTGGRMKKVTLAQMTAYGVKDTDACRRIGLKFAKELKDQDLWGIYCQHTASDMKIANILYKMEVFGAPIDRTEISKLEHFMQTKLTYYHKRMEHIVGKEFNPNSDKQLRTVLFEDLTFPIPEKRTPGGKISTDKEVISGLIEKYPNNKFLKNFRMHRNYTSIEETFVRGLEKKLDTDGRLHPDFGYTRTVSGRIVCYKPNLANIPRDKEFEEGVFVSIRSLFAAAPGKKIIYGDSCLTGNTKIITDDGIHSMRWLCEKSRNISALSVNADMKMEFQPISRAAKIGHKKIYKLTFRDGSSVRCTSEHKWMRLNGEMKRTDELVIGDKFSHVYTWNGRRGEVLWSFKGEQEWAHRFIARYAYGECPTGMEVDHIDGNANNFSRKNLRYLEKSTNRAQGGQRYWKAVKDGKRKDHKRLYHLREALKNRRTYVGSENPNYGQKRGEEKPCTYCGNMMYVYPFAKNTKKFCSQSCAMKYRYSVPQNHEIISIDDCGYADIYQLTVDKNHNYVLENGLVSGNSQIEFKAAAVLSKDKKLIHALFVERADFHDLVARALYPKYEETLAKLHDAQEKLKNKISSSRLREKLETIVESCIIILNVGRVRSKNFNFGLIYGAQLPTLATALGTTVEKIEPYINRLAKRYPKFEYFIRNMPLQAIREGELISPFNRRRRFPPTPDERVESQQARQGGNFLPQSSAAYVGRASLVRIAETFERTGMNAHPFNIVYDAILVESPDDEAVDAAEIVAMEMLRPVPELDNHSFSIELGIGQNWHEAEKQNAKKIYTMEDFKSLALTV